MGKKRNKVEIFKLEDRVLFEAGAVVQAAEAAAADQANNDAAAAEAGATGDADSADSESAEMASLAEMPVPPEMSGSDNAADTADADAADFAAADPESEAVAFADAPIAASETSERILVVLNSSVADADSIVNDLGDNVEVLRLTSGTDALDTINDYLDEHADTKYSAIHLVSHGSEGYITLNGEKIDSTTINPADWKAIGEHLTDDADILVYGCDTAKSDEGKALVQTIANLTGADVAASIDSTGANGNWDLEYRSGLIEAATIKPVSYQYDLPATTITVNSLVDSADDGSADTTTLREAITAATTNGGEYIIVFDQTLAKNADLDGNTENGYEGYQINLTSTLSISKSGLNLTIDGMIGTDRVILDGGDKYDGTTVTTHSGVQIMNIKSGTTVAVDGIQFQNAYSTANGAAISNAGTVTISNSVFYRNTVSGSSKYGAVLYNDSTGIAVIDSSFAKDNVASGGGGILFNKGGVVALMNSTITGSTGADYVIYDAFGNQNTRTYVIGSTIVGNSIKCARLYNSLVINSIVTDLNSPGGVTSKVLNCIYTGTNGYPKLVGSNTKVAESTTSGSILMQLFGSDNPVFSEDGTLTPVLAAAKGKAALLKVVDTVLETDDGNGNITTTIRKDLQYSTDDGASWATLQTGTKITNEILALTNHDQVGHSRGTKTIGAVSLKEDASIHTLVVNTTNGLDEYDGKTSIEEAIAYANTLSGAQTITFAQDLAYNHDADGDGENDTYLVNLNKSMTVNTTSGLTLTIDGSIGEDKVTLDAGGKFRHFSFSNATITLQDMTLQNGAVAGNGGAISNSGTLTVDNVAFYDNAVSANSKGGAIYNNGKLTVWDSEFIGNSTSGTDHKAQGGAIYADNAITVYNSLFENNTSRHNGGAITGDSTIKVYDSEFIGNKSSVSSGGAIYAGPNLIVDGSYFDGNKASSRGDGIDVESGSNALISDSTFVNHGEKAAVYAIASGSGKTVNATIINSTFLKNTIDVVHYNHNKGSAHLNVYNSVLAGSTGLKLETGLNDTSSADVKNTIYTASTNFTPSAADGNIKATAADIFGSNTLNENGTIMPVLDAALNGAAKLQVVTTQVDESTTRKDLQMSTDGGTTWTTVQTSTLATEDILAKDQLGNLRDSKTIGALNKPEVTLQWNLAESGYTYNGDNQTVTVHVMDGETVVNDITVELTYKVGDTIVDAMRNAGSYTITVDANALNTALGTKYVLADGAELEKTVEVQQKTITISNIAAANKEYNGLTDVAVTFDKDGILDVEADKVTLTVSGTFADQNVGTDKKVDLVWNLSGDASANYKLSGNVADTTADITAKEVALDWTADDSYIYNGKDQSGTVNATYTDVNGVEQDVVIRFNESFKNAGDYTATAESVANYTFTNATQSLTIGKATVTVTADNQTITEGNEDPTLTYMVEGLADGDVFTGTLVRAEGTGPGTYAITLAEGYTILNGEADMSGNYTLNYVGANLTIEAAATPEPTTTEVTLKWDLAESGYTYNGADQFVTVTLVDGEGNAVNGIEVVLKYNDAAAMHNAGTYTITVDANALNTALGTEYVLADGAVTTQTVEVQQKTITISNIAAANKEYNGLTDATVTFDKDGILDVDADKVTLTVSGTFADQNVGTDKKVDLVWNLSGDASANYKLAGNVADTTADITAKEVALDWTADNSYIYNGKDQSGTVKATYTDVNGEVQNVAISFNEVFKNAGTYTATAGSVANYTFTNATQSLTIGKATVTVTADNQTITEGNEDPTLTYMVEGLADGDVFTGTLVRAEGTEPGTYAITLAEGYTILNGEADMSGNYTLNYVGANLTIEAAAEPDVTQVTLEWTVGDYTYDGENHTVEVKVVAGNTVIDTIDVTLTYTFKETTVDAMRNAGEYTITVDAAALEAALGTEYVLAAGTELEKTVEMQQKVITVTAHAKSMMAGTLEPALTYTVEGLIGTDTLTGALEREAGTEAGEYDIKIGTLKDESGNYKINFTDAKFTITERVVDAAALVVTTTDDVVDAADGKVSLREAIEYAVSIGGETITFSKDVDWTEDNTIALTGSYMMTGDLLGSVTIDGSYTYMEGGETKTGRMIIDATGKNYRVFIVTDSNRTDSAFAFTLKNFGIKGGTVSATQNVGLRGGAIWASAVDLTLDHVTISDTHNAIPSTASSGDSKLGAGGALAIGSGSLTILNSDFDNNKLQSSSGTRKKQGGAIWVGGGVDLTIRDSVIQNTTQYQTDTTAGGGALYVAGSTGSVLIENTKFLNNTSAANGGAIYFAGERTATITGSIFEGNSTSLGGGAIFGADVILIVENSTFKNNHANGGSGGAILTSNTDVAFTVRNVTFTGNTATASGGAIYRGGYYDIENSAFINNTAANGGAAFFAATGGYGVIRNSTFFGNEATVDGGALYFTSNVHGNATLVNLTIAGNHAGGYGGGIYQYYPNGRDISNLYINSIVLGNTVDVKDGEGTVTGTAYSDLTFYQNDTTTKYFAGAESVFGVVQHLGLDLQGTADGTAVTNPIINKGNLIIGEVQNLEYNTTDANSGAIYRPGAKIYNTTLYTDVANEKIVDTMVKSVFGNKVSLNPDGKTVHTYAVENLTTNGVLVAWNPNLNFNANPPSGDVLAYQYYDETEGADRWKTIKNGTASVDVPWPAGLLETDQLGNNRKVSLDGGQTYFYVKGATAGLDGNPLDAENGNLVVDTLEDGITPFDFKVSLREAVEYANANGGGTITFSNAIDWLGTGLPGNGGTITLAPEYGALEITSNITIESKLDFGTVDQGYVTISGGDATQIFTIAADAGLTLSNITLTNGFGADGNGGAIYNAGTLTMTDSTVSNSKVAGQTEGIAVSGGAIYNAEGATLTLTNTDFTSNSAVKELETAGLAKGGAIYNAGTLTISGGVFDGNSAQIDGGTITNSGSATITGATIKNTTGSSGIYSFNSTLVVTDSTFTGNAISIHTVGSSNVLIEGALFTGNTDAAVNNSGSTVTIVNSVFVGNTIGGNKGIITTSQGGKTLILNSTVAGNTGAGHGIYAMASSSKVDIYNSVITDRIKILDSTPVNLYSTVYALTDGAGLTADTNSIQVVASDADGSVLMQVFGKDTVSAETGLLPKIDKALTGGIQFKVEGSDLKYHNGTEWLTIQSNTLMTDAQAGSDYNGADRRGAGLYTMGAYDGSGLIVTTNSDNAEDGNTLREAVAFAVANGGGTITFAAGKDWESMGTITLDSTIAVSTDLIGAITIDGSYTKADGSDGRINIVNGYTLNAKGQKVYQNIYLFNVKDTATATASSFTLKNLTFNGLNYTNVAGVVAGTGLTLNMDHVAISNSVVKSTQIFNGNNNATVGFVYIQSGTLNLTDSVFENNTFTLQQTMSSGVLITAHKSSTVLMENVKFLDNSMTGTRALANAGTMMVYIADASPSTILRDVEFSGNKALVATEAAKVQTGVSFLEVRTPVVTVERMTAENNTSYNSAFYFKSSGELRDSTFRNNTVTSGSTIRTDVYGTGYLKIINTLFEGNSGKNGGAVSGGHVDITDSAFINNTATGNGGALAISIVGASNVKNSTFFGNSAANGGAIYLYSEVSTTAAFTLTNLTIAGNTATGHGGGIYALDTSTSNTASSFNVMIGNSIILGNKAGADQHAEDYAFRADNQVPTNKLSAAANSIIGAVAHVGVDGQTTVRNPLVNAYNTSIIVEARNVALNDTQDGYVYSAGNILTLDTEHTIDNLVTTIFGSRIRLNADGRSVRTFAVEGLTLAGERTAIYHQAANSEFNKASDATLYVRDTANDTWIVMRNGKISQNAAVTTTTTGTSGNVEFDKDQYGLDRTFVILWPDANGVPVNTTFTAMGATTTFTIDPLTVTTLDDVMDLTDGKTSLREAIEYANQEGGNQTITFSNATDWLGTGTFGSGAELTLNPALGALNVTANITIDGALVYGNGIDQGTLTITGGDAIQIFTIAAGGGMTISNMSLTNGNAGEGNGGAISNAGTLTLTNVNVSNSKAMNGGAIYSTGSLTVNGGTFYGNSVDGSDNLTGNGGAIHSTGTATISNAVFDSNSAKYNGGAIYNSGTLTITGGVFSGHSAQNGVLFNQGNLLISGGTYTGNTANVLGTWGGTALIANAEIFGNTAADTINVNGNGSVIIIGSTIADNGTNVINAVSGSANVYNSILEGATAGTVNLYSSVYTSTTATADTNSILVTESAEAGSALKQIFGKEELSISGGLLPILDKALTGGIQFQVDGSDNLQYHNGTEWITIQANTLLTDAEAGRDITGANRRGAGLYTMGAYDASGLIVTTSADTVDPDDGKNSLREAIAFAVSLGGGTITFSKNVNWGTEGTTIKVTSTFNITAAMTGTLTIDGSLKYVDANGVETDYGRMTLDGGNTVTVAEDGKITFGKTGKRIFKVSTSGTFTLNNLILQNAYYNGSDDADKGGAVVWQSGGSFNMDNCYIVHNTAVIGNNVGGAAVRFQNVKFHISDSKFEGNGFSSGTSNAAGGALFINGCTSADNTITNTDFLKNYADAAGNGKGGGAIAIRGASVVTITGGEFTENYAIRSKGSFGGEAGAIWLDGKNSKLVIDGATFSKNHADYAGGAIKMEKETILEVRNSTFTENYSVKGNGGAIAQPQAGTATITNSYFSKNEAVNGGAVFNNSGIITILNNVFTYNKATGANGAGGAVRIGNANGNNPNESRTEDGAWITNSTFYGNSAAYGGAIANASSGSGNHPYFHNLTIAGNTATKKGGGFFAQHHATTSNTITNSIILGNTVGTDADDVCMVQDKASNGNHKFSISNSVIGVFRHGGFGTIDSGYSYSAKHTQHVALSGTVYLKELWGIRAAVDADGNPVQTPVLDAEGNPTVDAEGNPVLKQVYEPYAMTIANQLTDADYNKIFVGNGGEGYKIYLADDGKSVLLRHAGKDILANVTKPRKDTDQLGEAWTQYGEKYLVGAVGKLADNLSLVVTTDQDVVDAYDGLISLREAIAYQKADPTLGNTITFSRDVDWSATDKTITLDGEDAEGNLLGALAVTSNITIDGSLMYGTVDCGTITIDGADAVQLFTIASGVAADFSNMTFANGFAAGNGGAVYNEGTLSLTNTTFRENTAGPIGTDFIGNGGAIYNNGGTLTIADSRFENNLADGAKASHHGGGALFVNGGSAAISNTVFTGNNGYTGGAIEIAGNNTTTVTISDSVFSNNISRMWDFWGSGGAISIGSGSATLSITGTLFDGNTVAGGNNYGINGGAIAIRDTAQVFIDSSTFVNHTNGVFAVRGSYGAHMTIINSTIINNETSANGASGGIFFQETNDSYTLINSLVGNNKGFDFFSTGADNSTYSQLHHVITTGNSGYWNGGSATATLGGASLTVLSAADFKALFADGSFDADGKVVLTADGTVAINKDGAAAYAGALVGKLDGAYYYAVDGYWYSLDGTKGNALTNDAATGYGLGDTATIYTSAKNTDANGDKVSRVLTTLAFNIGSHALDTVETPSLVVNVAQDAFNPFDGKTTLREAIAEAQRNGGTVTFDQAAIAASGARTVTVGSDTYYVIDILKTANGTNNGSAFIMTKNLSIDGGTNKIMLDISKSNGTSMQVGRYFEYAVTASNNLLLTVKNLVVRGSGSDADGNLDLTSNTARAVAGAFAYASKNSRIAIENVTLERFNTTARGIIDLNAWSNKYEFTDSIIQDNKAGDTLIYLHAANSGSKFSGITVKNNTSGSFYKGIQSTFSAGKNVARNTFTGNTFSSSLINAWQSSKSYTLSATDITDNTMSELFNNTSSSVTMSDVKISGNTF